MTKINVMDLIKNREFREIHDELKEMNPVDIAELLEDLDEKDRPLVFRMLDKERGAEVFSYMDDEERQELVKSFTDQEITYILDSMYTDDAVDFLEEMPANVVTRLLERVRTDTRRDVNMLLKYPEDSAGSIMTVEYATLKKEMTVGEALDKIRTIGIHSETIYTCYVVENKKLLGLVTAKDLITHERDEKIIDLMLDQFVSIRTTDNREDAAKMFSKYGLIVIPVLDPDDLMVGIVTFDDAIDVLQEETTEDMQKMAAMEFNEESYLKSSVFSQARHRIVWLLILMFSASITGAIITRYEEAFAVIPLLVSFIPMLMDTGGNCGSQSSTLIIRGLAIDELNFSDAFQILWKEFRVAILVGITLALANGLRIYLVYKNLNMAIVVALSLIATIIVAKVVGSMLPLLAKKCKLDPAIMASPIITTVVDTCSIIIYFKIATILFKL
ncbi:magnesium transporter [Aequitasia blattaphilus]|uniref:Magnesium transporter MgtE n=1 Tax=Aequitasia blattaphilus TaxID=2949332 RepID=A0ABT1ECU8_9FIRM|nr:magnesium transporter [Aequitasia blattaphilus]MCP1102307.1 magnesium transporter [Aequitasia blattaphilus]MCR8614947.1 magnesium transporter [Aequitasia blattaphilus]